MLDRVLEPELMDTPEEAIAYDAMDHEEVNRQFVVDLLSAAGMAHPESPERGIRPESSERAAHPESAVGVGGRTATPLLASARADGALVEVLDLGTGTALQPIELCRQNDGVRVVAVDAAENMLDVARGNIEIAMLTDRIMLNLVDAKRLPFEDGRFPIVISNSIIHHIPEPSAVVREAVRVTAPGGLLFFRDLKRPETDVGLAEIVATYAGDATEHQRRMFADSLIAALSLGEIRSLVGQIGFPPETAQGTSDRHWTWTARKDTTLRAREE